MSLKECSRALVEDPEPEWPPRPHGKEKRAYMVVVDVEKVFLHRRDVSQIDVDSVSCERKRPLSKRSRTQIVWSIHPRSKSLERITSLFPTTTKRVG